MTITPNRVAAILAAAGALAAGVAPVVANMDWSSTAGIIAGIVGAVAVANKWLDGWQKHEGRQGEIAVAQAQAVAWQEANKAPKAVPVPVRKATAPKAKKASGGPAR